MRSQRQILLLLSVLVFVCTQITPKARLQIDCPANQSFVPPTFKILFKIVVTSDSDAYNLKAELFERAKVCVQLDEEEVTCHHYRDTSLDAFNLSLGSHLMQIWLRSGDGSGEVLVEASQSEFEVVPEEEIIWRNIDDNKAEERQQSTVVAELKKKKVETQEVCKEISFNIKSPQLGDIYEYHKNIAIKIELHAAHCPDFAGRFSKYEYCIVIDDHDEQCVPVMIPAADPSRVTENFGYLETYVAGLAIGTHALKVTLVGQDGNYREVLAVKPHTLFDIVQTSMEQEIRTLPKKQDTKATVPNYSLNEIPLRTIRVAILAINLQENSQTTIFERIALYLPKPLFDIHIFAPARSFATLTGSEPTVISRLRNQKVPLHSVLNYDNYRNEIANGGEISLWELDALVAKYLRGVPRATHLFNASVPSPQWAIVHQALQFLTTVLSNFDITTVANSYGVPTTEVFAECSRLAERPRLVLELPNLFPDANRLAASVNAIIAPSKYALGHPSIRSFTETMTKRNGNIYIPEKVIYPIALSSTSNFSTAEKSSYASKRSLVVACIGRLAVERSPGLILHTISALVASLSQSNTSLQVPGSKLHRSIQVLVAGDGPLRDALESHLLPHLMHRYRDWESSSAQISVKWLGQMSHNDILKNVLKCADVLLNVRMQGETFGITNAEAVEAGIPVVAFARGANDESVPVIDNQRCGRLVEEPFTASRLANALLEVLHSLISAQSPFNSAKCSMRARELFGKQRFVDEYKGFYEEIVQQTREPDQEVLITGDLDDGLGIIPAA